MTDDTNIIDFPGASRQAVGIKCTRLKRDGNPCGNYAVRGSDRCSAHMGVGAVRRQAQESATETQRLTREQLVEKLFALVEPSVKALEQIINAEGLNGLRTTDRLRAIEIVMDRTVGKKIEVGVDDTDEKDLDDEINEAFGAALAPTGTDDAAAEEWLGEGGDHDDDDD
jgi:hypothetical protein